MKKTSRDAGGIGVNAEAEMPGGMPRKRKCVENGRLEQGGLGRERESLCGGTMERRIEKEMREGSRREEKDREEEKDGGREGAGVLGPVVCEKEITDSELPVCP